MGVNVQVCLTATAGLRYDYDIRPAITSLVGQRP